MLRTLLLMPSFYGTALFGVAYALYVVNVGEYEYTSPELHLVCLIVILTFTLATAHSFSAYAKCGQFLLAQPVKHDQNGGVLIVVLQLIGLWGIDQYFNSLVEHFGSALEVVLRLIANSADIRLASPDVTSIGIQISYFGWIAIWFTVLMHRSGFTKWLLIVMSVIQFGANLLFIDRTRPTWILFVAVLLLGLKHFKALNTRLLVTVTTLVSVGFLSVFVLVGAWVGKIDVSSRSGGIAAELEYSLEPAYFYITSGFAYFNRVLILEKPDMTLSRSLYPVWMVGAHFGVLDPPPSQINEFLPTPNPTNVGTFLEPLYRDGGLGLLLAGIVLHAFGFNWLGVRLLVKRSKFCLIAWAVLCFTDAISFFTPKYANAPTWLFVGFGIVTLAGRAPSIASSGPPLPD